MSGKPYSAHERHYQTSGGIMHGNSIIATCLIVIVSLLGLVQAVKVNQDSAFSQGYKLGWGASQTQLVERKTK